MQGRFYSLNEYLCNQFGGKIYKLALDIGCTCPNRDGTLDTRGCIFCHNGSSHFAETGVDINIQIENAKNRVKDKIKTQASAWVFYIRFLKSTWTSISIWFI